MTERPAKGKALLSLTRFNSGRGGTFTEWEIEKAVDALRSQLAFKMTLSKEPTKEMQALAKFKRFLEK